MQKSNLITIKIRITLSSCSSVEQQPTCEPRLDAAAGFKSICDAIASSNIFEDSLIDTCNYLLTETLL